MTDGVRQQSREELEAIGRNLRALRECKKAAEQGRECGHSPPLPCFPTRMTVGVMADVERSYSCRGSMRRLVPMPLKFGISMMADLISRYSE